MIKQKTVFILGAGASKPYGYPTGEELKKYICNDIIHDSVDFFRYDRYSPYITKSNELIQNFTKSTNKSIDLFLTRNPQFEKLGKFFIAFSIMKSELESKSPDQIDNVEDWFSELFDRITDELTEPNSVNNFLNNNFSFITFNYDRSLEHFLFQALTNSYTNTNPKEIAKILLKIPIVHVYGKLVDLPWENSKTYLPYKEINYNSVSQLAKNINVIYSNRIDEERIMKAKKLIKDADRIFFLGFGFASENMKILGIPDSLDRNKRIYATAYKNKDKEIQNLVSKFKNSKNERIHNLNIMNYGSKELLRNFL